jgi:hypothetical protein
MTAQPDKRRGPLLWLAARSRRFWIVTVLVPLLYVASFGPACWMAERQLLPKWPVANVYLPCVVAAAGIGIVPNPVSKAMWWWATLSKPGSMIVVELVASMIEE